MTVSDHCRRDPAGLLCLRPRGGQRPVRMPVKVPMRVTRLPVLAVGLLLAAAAACTLEEDFLTAAGTELRFSVDTLRFDTVFTEVGTATRSFKVYNPHTQPVSIASIRVASDAGGRFRINVDGVGGADRVEDVFLPPEDSIYVFVEVTVDPDVPASVSPFVFHGTVVVQAVDVEQVVTLEAFGQNAVYLPADRTRANFGVLTCDLGELVFDDPRPYVLYGSLVVDSCTLTLPPGCRLYVHGGLVANPELFPQSPIFNDGLIIVAGAGKLNVAGTAEQPVLIASDRLEERFREVGGQYSGIRLGAASGPHRIRHARIRNGIVGVFADSLAELEIRDTEIAYTTSAAIVGYQADIRGVNVAAHSNGGGAVRAIKGGRYGFDHCTFVNYTGREAAVALSNGFQLTREVALSAPLEAEIRNSIIYGSLADELALIEFKEPPAPFAYSLRNSVLRSTRVPVERADFADRCIDCLFPPIDSPLFLLPSRDTFLLDTLSVAEGIAAPLPGVEADLLGNPRDAVAPDAGAYEYVPQ